MIHFNWFAILVSTLIPLVVGFVWYNPKVLGTAWMHATGMTPEKAQGANMVRTFSITIILSFLVTMFLHAVVIHQIHMYSILANDPNMKDPNSAISQYVNEFMKVNGNNFRTFKHGAFHGFFTGVVFALPVITINALFEMRSFKYIAINAGYWIISLMLMGAVICGWQ